MPSLEVLCPWSPEVRGEALQWALLLGCRELRAHPSVFWVWHIICVSVVESGVGGIGFLSDRS